MGLGGGRVWGGGEARSAHRGPNCGGCWRGTCGAHPKHLYHGCDAGRAEAQRLVEGRRFLPRSKGSIRRGAACGPGSGRAWSGGGASSVQGQASSGGCWQGTRGAHVKHVVHVCYAGGIPARYVCVELVQVIEEIGHVCDCRDAPARDGAVRRSGGSRVGVVLLGRRPQGGRVREGIGRWRRRSRRQWRRWWRRRRARAQAAPIRTVPIVKLGAARPCAPDEDLVCVGQRGALPRSIGSGATCRAGRRRGCCWSGV